MSDEHYLEMRALVREPKFQMKRQVAFELERRHPGRFVPRYSMVMFHHIPYAEARRRAALQEAILDELCGAVADPARMDQIDWTRADALVEARFPA
jgi:kynurenine 3-monooxygenase